MRPRRLLALATAATMALGAGAVTSGTAVAAEAEDVAVPGLAVATSDQGFEATYTAITDALRANPAITVVAEVDHAANAARAGLELEPTRVVLFGNPALGTPLMQDEQQTGIDLPQKLLVWQDGDHVLVAYNTVDHLVARHGLDADSAAQQAAISNALAAITEAATGAIPVATPPTGIAEDTGLVAVDSRRAFAATQNALERGIRKNDALTLVTVLDHQANAASVGLELRPTTVTYFGNPALGTPLMQDERTVAIDLPQSVLVLEDAAGDVTVLHEDPSYLAARHGLDAVDAQLATIEGALTSLARLAATGRP